MIDMDDELTVTKEDELKECLELCRMGAKMCRIKAGCLATSRNVHVEDQKWLCYHSDVCWKFVPLKFKSGKLLILRIGLQSIKRFASQFYLFLNLLE